MTDECAYDSTADTLRHSLRVGELMGQPIRELVDRSVRHDLSKTEEPELSVFNEYSPKLKHSTYGSEEYKRFLAAMKPALDHHYAVSRHHPEHYTSGINGMTLVDLIELLADWKAATERHADGDLARSLEIQRERFGISEQLAEILTNTAGWFGWLGRRGPVCGVAGRAPNGDKLSCSLPAGPHEVHFDGLRDSLEWRDGNLGGFDEPGAEWRHVGTSSPR